MNPETQEHRKSSVETEMENYLKSELGDTEQSANDNDIVASDNASNGVNVDNNGANSGAIVDNPPDLLLKVVHKEDSASKVIPDDAMVTSAIISVDDVETDNGNEADTPDKHDDKGDTNEASNDNVENDKSSSPQSQKSVTPPKITLPKIQISPEMTSASGMILYSANYLFLYTYF